MLSFDSKHLHKNFVHIENHNAVTLLFELSQKKNKYKFIKKKKFFFQRIY